MAQYPTDDYPRDLQDRDVPEQRGTRRYLVNLKCECPADYRKWNFVTGRCACCMKQFSPPTLTKAD